MKVFCINGDGWATRCKLLWFWNREKKSTGPGYGDIVTVVGEYYDEGKLWYLLLEWPVKEGGGFDADCFIPLSDIDEIELVNKYFKEKVNELAEMRAYTWQTHKTNSGAPSSLFRNPNQ